MTAVVSRSAEETLAAGAAFAARLEPGTVVALHGDLGAGKTTFVRGVVKALVNAEATSPTFSIVHTFTDGVTVVHHVDAFRIESEAELDELGFDDYLDGAAIVLVEWPENLGSRLPGDALHVTLRHADGSGESTDRHITIEQR